MDINDIIGSLGTVMMLTAFILNLTDRIDDDDLSYILLNLFGGTLACYASCMIPYIPFIVLEGVWSIASLWGLYDYVKRKIKYNETR